jgi:DNA-binding XRE family transcriptional regulator
MIYLAQNLKHLRTELGYSQAYTAEKIGIPRTTLGDYERGHTEPNMDLLTRLAKLYQVQIDDLLNINLKNMSWDELKSGNVRVLTMTLDPNQTGNIELVKTKAAAGYIGSFHDPEFVGDLPKILIPSLQGHFRAFEIEGDSMLPMESGSIVICRYVEKINDIKNNQTYIVVSTREGLVYKRLQHDSDQNTLLCKSDNNLYPPFRLPYEEVKEIWEYHAHIAFREPKAVYDSFVEDKIGDMQMKLNELHKHYIGKQT